MRVVFLTHNFPRFPGDVAGNFLVPLAHGLQARGVEGIRVLQGLRDDGRMIVVSTHDSRLVPIADRIVQLIPVGGHDEIATHEVTYAAGDSVFEQGDDAAHDRGVAGELIVVAQGNRCRTGFDEVEVAIDLTRKKQVANEVCFQ